MELSPEEKRRVYEEEKARLEAEDKASRESGRPAAETSTGLDTNVAALLCYLGWWITGLIFFILEQKDLRVRFHAAQSLVFFAAVVIVSIIVRWIPFVGVAFSVIVILIGFIFWIVLMVKAYQGEHYMLPVAGEIAERMAGLPGYSPRNRHTPPPPPPSPTAAAAAPPPPAATETITAQPLEPDRQEEKKAEKEARRYRRERQEARIAGGAVAIAFLIAVFVVFNFFYRYIGYINIQGGNDIVPHSIFTGEISRWLPYLNAAVVVGIIGQLFLMFVDNTFLRRSARLVMDALGFVAVVALLLIYPFDFSVIPNSDAAFWAPIVITAILIFIAVVLGIVLIVRIIQLLVQAVRVLLGSEELD